MTRTRPLLPTPVAALLLAASPPSGEGSLETAAGSPAVRSAEVPAGTRPGMMGGASGGMAGAFGAAGCGTGAPAAGDMRS